MVHLLALWRVELHLSNRLAEEQGSMPCTSWPDLDNSQRRARSGKEEGICQANHRAGNRRNQAALEWKRIRRPAPKPRRARSGWPTSAGTTAPRISSSPAGNGSPAGAAGRSFTRRSSSDPFFLSGGDFPNRAFSIFPRLCSKLPDVSRRKGSLGNPDRPQRTRRALRFSC